MGVPGAKTTMYNAQAVLTAQDYICVTEGEIDCVTTVVKTGHPAVGIPGTQNWKPFYSKILDDFETVVILADGDNPGLEFGKKVSRELGNVNIIQMPEGHDVNSIVMKEGKEWLDERIRRVI
jgi:DNA primase